MSEVRSIDANALKKAVNDFFDNHFKGLVSNELITYAKAVDNAIDTAPTVEPERPQGECRTCRHRDPEDKKCDCGGLERVGCPFPVSDDYFCKFYEKGGAE